MEDLRFKHRLLNRSWKRPFSASDSGELPPVSEDKTELVGPIA